MMNIHITDFTGLCNRLEALAVALCIREYYPAEIFCRWPESDSFHIPSIKWNCGGWRRWRRTKIRELSDEGFRGLDSCGNLYLRGIRGGPKAAKLRQLRWIRDNIRLHPRLVKVVQDQFDAETPVVGVHLRRGDFQVAKDARYRALGDSWLRKTLDLISASTPGVRFFLSHTGDGTEFSWIYERYDAFSTNTTSPYTYKGPAHSSANHPVLDLFSLACCTSVVVTPGSSFSHWATNILGEPGHAIFPCGAGKKPFLARRSGVITLEDWAAVVREDPDVPGDLPAARPPNLDWL
jgi:hypothetical protein